MDKAEAVQEQGLQRKPNRRVLPRGDPSICDEASASGMHGKGRTDPNCAMSQTNRKQNNTHTQIDLEQCNRNVTLHGLLDRIVLPT